MLSPSSLKEIIDHHLTPEQQADLGARADTTPVHTLHLMLAGVSKLMEANARLHQLNNRLEASQVPVLAGAHPVVLYFGSLEDADEFIGIVKQAKPGLTAHKFND